MVLSRASGLLVPLSTPNPRPPAEWHSRALQGSGFGQGTRSSWAASQRLPASNTLRSPFSAGKKNQGLGKECFWAAHLVPRQAEAELPEGRALLALSSRYPRASLCQLGAAGLEARVARGKQEFSSSVNLPGMLLREVGLTV